MKRLMLVLAMVISLMSGCATLPTPTPLELDRADYGPYPDNYVEIIKAVFNAQLFDPYSAVYTFTEPRKGWSRSVNPFYGVPIFGWIVCGTLNAKNRMGGYVGASPFFVLICEGHVRSKTWASQKGTFHTGFVRGKCQGTQGK